MILSLLCIEESFESEIRTSINIDKLSVCHCSNLHGFKPSLILSHNANIPWKQEILPRTFQTRQARIAPLAMSSRKRHFGRLLPSPNCLPRASMSTLPGNMDFYQKRRMSKPTRGPPMKHSAMDRSGSSRAHLGTIAVCGVELRR